MDSSDQKNNASKEAIMMHLGVMEGMLERVTKTKDLIVCHSLLIANLCSMIDMIVSTLKTYNTHLDDKVKRRIDKLSENIKEELKSLLNTVEKNDKTKRKEKSKKKQQKAWKKKVQEKAEKKWKKKSEKDLKKTEKDLKKTETELKKAEQDGKKDRKNNPGVIHVIDIKKPEEKVENGA